jgi:hypothetical protein
VPKQSLILWHALGAKCEKCLSPRGCSDSFPH